METSVRNLTIEECLTSFGGERRVYYMCIKGKIVAFYYNA